MKFTAFIPIKYKSERVKDKNFTLIKGKPLFFYIINTLKSIDLIDQILIDTDDEKVVELIENYFTDIDFKIRDECLKAPTESVNKIIKSNLDNINNDFIFQTHTTNPLLKEKTINKVLEEYIKNKQSIFSVNVFQSRFYDQELKPINHNPEELIPTQELDFIYEENSNFYIFSKEQFKDNNFKRIGKDSVYFSTKKSESIDIDNEEDLELLKKILE
tara:strand:- start:1496 stop:2143 length:648 start_codon:yes stop_codon:yes gene_type:complete